MKIHRHCNVCITLVLAMVLSAALISLNSCDDRGEPQPIEACCNPADKPGTGPNPACIEGATCCADGTWQCNQGTGEPACDNNEGVCLGYACDPADEPGTGDNQPCFEGATCCPDGLWHCNDFGGSPTCE